MKLKSEEEIVDEAARARAREDEEETLRQKIRWY